MPDMLAHEWFRPRLTALLAEAEKAGYARDVAQAAITDLVNGALMAVAPAPADEAWSQDIGEPAYMVNQPPGGGGSADGAFDGRDTTPLASRPFRAR